MISLIKIVLKILPWLLTTGLLSWMLLSEKLDFTIHQGTTEVYQNSILTQVEAIGKIELALYHFQEVTELHKHADYVELFSHKFKLTPDARALLISQGTAAGCIDLAHLQPTDFKVIDDTLHLLLPPPELCYYKMDLSSSRFYDLEISSLDKQKRQEFTEEVYKMAEQQIKQSALELGIMNQTKENAQIILKPMLENLANLPVVLAFRLSEEAPDTKL